MKAGLCILLLDFISERNKMARKHFEEYYSKIKNQYFDLLNTLKEADDLVNKNMADPQVLENLTAILQPVKNSYLSLAYIEYLLNLPKNKVIQKRNERQFKTLLSRLDQSKVGSSVIAQNNNAIEEVSRLIDEELR